jgi:hypothetical protein
MEEVGEELVIWEVAVTTKVVGVHTKHMGKTLMELTRCKEANLRKTFNTSPRMCLRLP